MAALSKTKENTTDKPQERILGAASAVFVEHGFEEATVREICLRAKVNLAAINYYFGNKKNLYLAVIKHWSEVAFEQFPPNLGVQTTDPPKKRLKAFIRSALLRVLDEGPSSWFGRLIAREFVKPTIALDILVEEFIRPAFRTLSSILREITKKKVDEKTTRLCCVSIIGQCLHFYNARPIMNRLFGNPLAGASIEEIADHIMNFSLFAMEGLAQKGERQ